MQPTEEAVPPGPVHLGRDGRGAGSTRLLSSLHVVGRDTPVPVHPGAPHPGPDHSLEPVLSGSRNRDSAELSTRW